MSMSWGGGGEEVTMSGINDMTGSWMSMAMNPEILGLKSDGNP